MFQQFALLKDIDHSTLDSILSQNDLYAKCHPSDISNLPDINPDNFVNICNFVDYYQLIDEEEFITNIQCLVLCEHEDIFMLYGHEDIVNNINFIPLNMQQKVYQNPCLTNMKCERRDIKHVACYKYFNKYDNTLTEAIYFGNLELVRYLFKIGKKCTQWAIDSASGNGHFEVVKYLFEVQHKNVTTQAIDLASAGNHLKIIKYLFEVAHADCTIDAINRASRNGHLEVVKYLFEVAHKDCSIDAINWASENGHLNVIKYLIEVQHKKYTQKTINSAKNKEIAQYLKSHTLILLFNKN